MATVLSAGACSPLPAPCSEHCDGNTKQQCNVTPPAEDCGKRTCVEAFRSYEAYAACAIGGPNVRCNSEFDTMFCDGNHVKTCHGNFVEHDEDCGARGLACATRRSPGGLDEAACVKSLVPLARCDDPSTNFESFCDEDHLAQCFGRLVRRGEPGCSAVGKRCAEHPGFAKCE